MASNRLVTRVPRERSLPVSAGVKNAIALLDDLAAVEELLSKSNLSFSRLCHQSEALMADLKMKGIPKERFYKKLEHKNMPIKFLLSVFLGLISSFAYAQNSVKKDATQMFKKGVSLFEAGEFEAAALAFRRAAKLNPSWKLQYNIGQSEAAATHYGLALEAFEQYLSEGGDEISSHRQAEVIEEVQRLRMMTGFLLFNGGDQCRIEVNGRERGVLPLADHLLVAMGKVTVVATCNGEIVVNRKFHLSGGKEIEINLEQPRDEVSLKELLGSSEQVMKHSHESEKVGEQQPSAPKRKWTYAFAGLGGATAMGAIITGSIALSKRNALGCADNTCPPSAESDLENAKRFGLVTDVLWISTGIAIATATALFFLEPKWGKRKENDQLKITATPFQNGAMLGALGQF